MGAAVWYAWGNTFAFSEGNNFIGTRGGYFLKDDRFDDDSVHGDVWSGTWYANWTFQWAFAATAATIVSGAVAERCTFNAYLIYSLVLTGFVYPVVAHWAWGGGAFSSDVVGGLGVIDFAGGGVVHMTGGLAAVVGAAVLGPRRGRFDPETGRPQAMPAQSTVFQVLGTFLLWVGWYGFNCVSTFSLLGESASATAAKVSHHDPLWGIRWHWMCSLWQVRRGPLEPVEHLQRHSRRSGGHNGWVRHGGARRCCLHWFDIVVRVLRCQHAALKISNRRRCECRTGPLGLWIVGNHRCWFFFFQKLDRRWVRR